MKIISVIPARYQSSRFEGKPLALIKGKPMIWWVYHAVSAAGGIAETYVATDDRRIYDTVEAFGGRAVMTGYCSCGTERVAEVCRDMQFDVVLNVQGDEPMVRRETLQSLISAFVDPAVKMATLRKKISAEREINNPHIVKVVTDKNSDAILFSRSAIPYSRGHIEDVGYYKHIGIYAYTRDFLHTFVSLPRSGLEKAEKLEQLRAIENGYKIRVVETEYESISVDLPEHIAMVEREMENG